MDIASEITAIEARAKACGLSVPTLCQEAEIHRATWQRWKAGITMPRLAAWRNVEDVLRKHEAAAEHSTDASPQPEAAIIESATLKSGEAA